MCKMEIKKIICFNTDEMNECERVIEMMQELSVGVNGFNESEIADILSFISTMQTVLNAVFNIM